MAVADAEVYDDAAAVVGTGDAGIEANVMFAVGTWTMRLRWRTAATAAVGVVVVMMAAAAVAVSDAIVSDAAAAAAAVVDRAQVSAAAVAAGIAESVAAAAARRQTVDDGAAVLTRPSARASMPFAPHLHADGATAHWRRSCNAIRRCNYSFDSARRFDGTHRVFVAAAAAAVGEADAFVVAARAEAPIRDWAGEHDEQRPGVQKHVGWEYVLECSQCNFTN